MTSRCPRKSDARQDPYGYALRGPLARSDPAGLCAEDGCVGEALAFCLLFCPDVAEAIDSGDGDSLIAGLEYLVGFGEEGLPGQTAAIPAPTAGGISVSGDAFEENPIQGYTAHGISQVLYRDGHGVCNEALVDAVLNPISDPVPQDGGTTLYRGANAVVVLNDKSQVVTAWATNSSGWRH